ncbi:acyclic terpene utilization AtuA family protein [Aureimonas phyllosphaerae]|uniref:Acyclic terpene utilisation N-terminal domain-containing protein n=1 Tax=Aureimonas phyllosphaerae TaxID=1166078 RepID=A0A7W6BU72_9HYPH|nr:acyclic terpene utilization AtuA family protein [Aureimonas phyllosphaerae]MBB3936997.1 hypothetical protein [Aureimonas phyllosphaerae]MBB3960888.1 hypothetical protein [Aureimonas phyllosphaerae]SFF51576.1 Protein of unknown function [Aureimonas phyllosphaerae]
MSDADLPSLVRIGCASGFADDRSDAGLPVVRELARHEGPRFLIYETLAERTLALAQLRRRQDPEAGASEAIERFLRPVLAECLASGIRIVGNFGAANPRGGARIIRRLAAELGHPDIRIAVVEGDDISDAFSHAELRAREMDSDLLADAAGIVSANAYIGAEAIGEGLDAGADVVVAGRVADPSLALGPLIHAFGWRLDDWDRLAAGTLAGHLLECGSQVTGGYFADPGMADVPNLAEVGYPIAEILSDGAITLTKPPGTGGRVDRETVAEQLLYEIHDPAAYLTPDVVLDLTEVGIEVVGKDRVRVVGARGRPRPERLKATVCVDGGHLAEGEISYAGANAARRAALAIAVVQARMARRWPGLLVRADAIGVASLFHPAGPAALGPALAVSPCEDVRVRLAAASTDRAGPEELLHEVRALYCAGPGGGAGIRTRLTHRVASASCLVERERVEPRMEILEPHHG